MDNVIISVQPTPYVPNDTVHVYISYELWMNPKLAEGIKKAVEMTFTKVTAQERKESEKDS